MASTPTLLACFARSIAVSVSMVPICASSLTRPFACSATVSSISLRSFAESMKASAVEPHT